MGLCSNLLSISFSRFVPNQLRSCLVCNLYTYIFNLVRIFGYIQTFYLLIIWLRPNYLSSRIWLYPNTCMFFIIRLRPNYLSSCIWLRPNTCMFLIIWLRPNTCMFLIIRLRPNYLSSRVWLYPDTCVHFVYVILFFKLMVYIPMMPP